MREHRWLNTCATWHLSVCRQILSPALCLTCACAALNHSIPAQQTYICLGVDIPCIVSHSCGTATAAQLAIRWFDGLEGAASLQHPNLLQGGRTAIT